MFGVQHSEAEAEKREREKSIKNLHHRLMYRKDRFDEIEKKRVFHVGKITIQNNQSSA